MEDANATRARAIIAAGAYMTLATADAAGLPWATPVWYAPEDGHSLLWISRPDARHSRNLAERAELGIVIFDSRQPIGTGEGVYLEAIGGEVEGPELERAVEAFSQRSVQSGGGPLETADVRPPAEHRMYRATAERAFVLDGHDQRVPVDLGPGPRAG